MTFQYQALKPEYSHLWTQCKLNSNKIAQFKAAANKVIKGKTVYQELESKTGVPWYFIGIVHLRESDCNFNTHLHNGDPLYRRTYHVPAGRPPTGNPPFTFEESAIDALKYEGFLTINDWSAERICYCLEQYNGWGYRYHHVPSAYLWAGTNNYVRGKYVADNVWSGSAVDTQLGAMGVLAMMEQIDPSIHVPYDTEIGETTFKAQPPVPQEAAKQMVQQSRKWNITSIRQRVTLLIASAVGTLQGLSATGIDDLKSFFDSLGNFVHSYGVWLLLGGLAAAFIADYFLKEYMKQDVQEGRAVPSGSLINVSTGEPV